MEEVRRHHVRGERRVALQEDHRHDAIADVSLALELLRVVLGLKQEGGNLEHHLLLAEHLVHALLARLSVQGVQPTLTPMWGNY